MRHIGLLFAVPAFVMIAAPAEAQTRLAPGTESRNAKAAFVYLSQATKDAALKPLDAALVEQRKRADLLSTKLTDTRAQLAQLRRDASASKSRVAELERLAALAAIEAAEAQEKFTQELASKDADYARELAVLRTAADEILSTPDGLKYLEANNAGDLAAADAIEEKLIAARQKLRDIQAAADRRAFAAVALDNRNKGLRTTASVITRFEEVTRLDPGNYQDWITLSWLYGSAGKHGAALDASYKAEQTAKNDYERFSAVSSIVFNLMRASRHEEALDLAQSTLKRANVLAGSDASSRTLHGIGQLQFDIGAILERMGQIDRSVEAYGASVATARKQADLNPSLPAPRAALAERLTKLGSMQLRKVMLDESLKSTAESVKIRRELIAAYPSFIGYQTGLVVSLSDLGSLLTSMKRFDAAVAAADEIIAIMTLIVEKDPAVGNLNLLAYGHTIKGLALVKSEQFEKAAPVLDQAIALGRRLVEMDPTPGTSHFRLLGNAYDQLGNANYATGDYRGACTAWGEALQLARKRVEASSGAIGDQVSNAIFKVKRGRCLKRLNDQAGAAEEYLGAMPMVKAALSVSPKQAQYRELMTEILASLSVMEIAGYSDREVQVIVQKLIADGQADSTMITIIENARKAAVSSAGVTQ